MGEKRPRRAWRAQEAGNVKATAVWLEYARASTLARTLARPHDDPMLHSTMCCLLVRIRTHTRTHAGMMTHVAAQGMLQQRAPF